MAEPEQEPLAQAQKRAGHQRAGGETPDLVMLQIAAEGAEVDPAFALDEGLAALPWQAVTSALLQQGIPETPEQGVDGQYGRGVFSQLLELPTEQWAGPIRSGYGQHLVSVLSVTDPQAPELESVREQVIAAWRAREVERLSELQYQALRDRYSIERPEGGA